MKDPTAETVSAFESPFSGEGNNLSPITEAGLDIRPVPLSTGILPKGSTWRYEHVFSPFCRLYFARHGDMFVQTDNETYRIPKRGFLLIPAEIHFHCNSDGSTEHLWVHFLLQPFWLDGFRKPIPLEGDATRISVVQSLWKHIEQASPAHDQVHLIKGLLHLLLCNLNLSVQSSVPHTLHRALRIIQDHLQKPLSVSSLARQTGYSPEHLAHLFRNHLRESPSEFIRNTRIREAARKLAYTNETIEAIADDLCFANRHHLSRVFKAIIKEPPAAFRNRIRRTNQTT